MMWGPREMAPPDAAPPASALAENGRRKIDLLGRQINSENTTDTIRRIAGAS